MPQNTVANNNLYQNTQLQPQQQFPDQNTGFYQTNPYMQQQSAQNLYQQQQQLPQQLPQQGIYNNTEGMQSQPIGYKNQFFQNYDDQDPFMRQMNYGYSYSPNQQQRPQQQPLQTQPLQMQPLNQTQIPPQNNQFAPQQNNQLSIPFGANINQNLGAPVVNPVTGRNQYGFRGEGLPSYMTSQLPTMGLFQPQVTPPSLSLTTGTMGTPINQSPEQVFQNTQQQAAQTFVNSGNLPIPTSVPNKFLNETPVGIPTPTNLPPNLSQTLQQMKTPTNTVQTQQNNNQNPRRNFSRFMRGF